MSFTKLPFDLKQQIAGNLTNKDAASLGTTSQNNSSAVFDASGVMGDRKLEVQASMWKQLAGLQLGKRHTDDLARRSPNEDLSFAWFGLLDSINDWMAKYTRLFTITGIHVGYYKDGYQLLTSTYAIASMQAATGGQQASVTTAWNIIQAAVVRLTAVNALP